MTREQIEKEALLFAGAGEWGECPYNPDAKNGFMAGAHWRINSVWHDASEKPDKNQLIVFECRKTYGRGYSVNFGENYDLLKNVLLGWAYVIDLLPERKEVRNDTRSDDVPSRVRWVRKKNWKIQLNGKTNC